MSCKHEDLSLTDGTHIQSWRLRDRRITDVCFSANQVYLANPRLTKRFLPPKVDDFARNANGGCPVTSTYIHVHAYHLHTLRNVHMHIYPK